MLCAMSSRNHSRLLTASLCTPLGYTRASPARNEDTLPDSDASVPARDSDARVVDVSTDAGADAAPVPLAPPLARPAIDPEPRCRLPGTRAGALPRASLQALPFSERFAGAVSIATLPDSPELLFVVEQTGRVSRVQLEGAMPEVTTVLDLSARADCCDTGGLRAIAFVGTQLVRAWIESLASCPKE